MPLTDDMKNAVREELDRRLGREILGLLEDTRKDSVLREEVTRWILIVRDLSMEAACVSAEDLFHRKEHLDEVLNLQVYSYTQAMEWAQAGWPEWLQTIHHAKFLHAEKGIEAAFKGLASDEVPVECQQMGALLNERSGDLARRILQIGREFAETYYHYLLADLQAEYLQRYPTCGRAALRGIGSPSALVQQIDLAADPDLLDLATFVKKLMEYQRTAESPGELVLEAFQDFVQKSKASAKKGDPDA